MRRAIASTSASIFVLILLAACDGGPNPKTASNSDQSPELRLVTLSPHLAELIFAIGAGDLLVGVSAYSNFPEEVRSLPKIGDAFLIDQEQLVLLAPDIVLAWKSGTPSHTVTDLRSRGYRVEIVQTNGLIDIAAALKRIGSLTGHEAQAESVAAAFIADIEKLRATHAKDDPIGVFYQIAPRPLYTANGRHYVSELIGLCGGQNIFADLSDLAPLVSEEAVIVRDPEVMIAGGIAAEDSAFAQWQRWPTLTANRLDNRFYVPADLLARPTPRLIQAGNIICDLLDTARKKRVGAGGR